MIDRKRFYEISRDGSANEEYQMDGFYNGQGKRVGVREKWKRKKNETEIRFPNGTQLPSEGWILRRENNNSPIGETRVWNGNGF